MKLVQKKCSDLIGAEYNPRELTEKQYSDLKDSLKRFGLVDPILVNINPERKNIIVGGHQRKRVWEELGNDTINCIELDLTFEKEKELNVRLNKNTGQFDMDLLANHFDTTELIDWGFKEIDLDREWENLDYIENADEVDLNKSSKLIIEIEPEYEDTIQDIKEAVQSILKNYNGTTIK